MIIRKQSLFVQSLLAATFSIALAVTGCSSSGGGEEPGGMGGDGGGGGTGGTGGTAGSGGGEGGMGGTGGTALTVSASPTGDPNHIFQDMVDVTLTASDPSATIYYTTDLSPVEPPSGAGGAGGDGGAGGSDGTGTQTYTGPIPLSDTAVLKFLAVANGQQTAEEAEGYVRAAPGSKREEWANSGHGDIAADAWREWDASGFFSNCARCHSVDGMLDYSENGSLSGGAMPSLGLDCGGCHQGTFPNTLWDERATYVELDPVTFPSGDEASFDNNSNICMGCHQGRESGADVDADIAACSGVGDCDAECTPTGAGGAGGAGGASGCEGLGFLNIHYYAAAASLFGSVVGGGYEYAGETYAGQNTFPAHPGGALNDCVECHMNAGSADKSHVFLPEVSACSGCHGNGATDDFKVLEPALKDNYDDIEALAGELFTEITDYASTTLGVDICYADGYPYWCVDDGGECGCSPSSGAYVFDATLLRAAYNYQVSQKEPCGYIHNGSYIKQLLFDSITDLGGTPSVTRP